MSDPARRATSLANTDVARGAPLTIGRAPAHTNPEHPAPKHDSTHSAHNKRDSIGYLVHTCTRRHTQASRSRRARRALRPARQPLAPQEVAKLIVSSTCAKGGVKEGPGQRQHVLHCRPHGGRGSGAVEDGRWGRQARSFRRGRHTLTCICACSPRSRGGRASELRRQRPRRRRATDPDLGRRQAGNQAHVSAGCLCKCQG